MLHKFEFIVSLEFAEKHGFTKFMVSVFLQMKFSGHNFSRSITDKFIFELLENGKWNWTNTEIKLKLAQFFRYKINCTIFQKYFWKSIYGTHREQFCFTQLGTRIYWNRSLNVFCLFTFSYVSSFFS